MLLEQIFKDGFSNVPCLVKRENNAIEPWIVFAASEKNDTMPTEINNCDGLPFEIMLKYQLQVLLSRAQPDWPLLLKVKVSNFFHFDKQYHDGF